MNGISCSNTFSKDVNSFEKQLEIPVNKEVFWTDSEVTLGYIGNESKSFTLIVANS